MASSKLFGYRMYKDKQSFTEAFEKLYAKEVFPALARGLSAAIYTQLSDVEDEINGLFTWDRFELKVDASAMLAINKKLQDLFHLKP